MRSSEDSNNSVKLIDKTMDDVEILQANVHRVQNVINTFAENGSQDIWGFSVTKELVKEAMSSWDLFPYRKPAGRFHDVTGFDLGTKYHAGRVAWLVNNGWNDPIDVDVGCPSLGHYDIQIMDGCHRLAAAIIRGDKTIPLSYSGEVNYAKHLFIRARKEYDHL